MTKFQKIQKILSVIPLLSSLFIFIVTLFELKRHKTGLKLWVRFALIFFGFGFIVFILNQVIMTGQHPCLSIIASGLILALANFLCVDLQIACAKGATTGAASPKAAIITGAIIAGIVLTVICLVGIAAAIQSTMDFDIADANGESNTNLAAI